MKFGFDWPSGFGGEDVRKWLTTTTTTTMDAGAWVYYNFGSGELKKTWFHYNKTLTRPKFPLNLWSSAIHVRCKSNWK